jgi:outer membrane lipoprotein SlyB
VPEPAPLAAPAPAPVRPAPRPRPACADCGRVERVEVVTGIRATATGGAVLGGVVGGVVSTPKRVATPASPTRAAIPGIAPANAASTPPARPAQRAWRVHLRMDDGRKLVVHQNLLSREIVAGSRVRLVQGRLVPLH